MSPWRWDPAKYLAFASDRTQPCKDLLHRIDAEPESIVDLGCGPGHLTPILRARWPDARIVGVDSSPEMIAWATRENNDPNVAYEAEDIETWRGNADMIISNAALQLVRDRGIIERLAEMAPVFAFQVPNNFDSLGQALLREIAGRELYASHLDPIAHDHGIDAQTCFTSLKRPDREVAAWETTYMHVVDRASGTFDWVSGTGARPFVEALPERLRRSFVDEYTSRLLEALPAEEWGTLLPHKRVFATCTVSRTI